MIKSLFILAFFTLSVNNIILGQYNGNNFSISTSVNYTTSARIFLNPNSPDIGLRSQVLSLSSIVSPSIELRYGLTDDIFLGLSTEIIKKTVFGNDLIAQSRSGHQVPVTVEDGFKVIPVELFVYYLLPFSTERFKILMGGGAAYYFGEQIRKVNGENVSDVNQDFAYGIQVNISSDYLVTDYLSIRTEMKFRDPEINVTSRYNTTSIIYNRQRLQIPNDSFDTRIDINGVTFLVGLGFHF